MTYPRNYDDGEALSRSAPQRSRVNARALVLLGIAEIAIGAAAISARFALTAAGPLSVSALRLLIASVPFVLFALYRKAYRPIDGPTEWRLVAAGAVLALHFATWIASLRYATVAVSTLLVCSTPIFTEAWAIARTRRASAPGLAGIALAIAGVALVTGAPSGTNTPLGIGLALIGAVAIAAYLLLVRASDARYTTLAVVARTYPIAAIALVLAATVARDRVPPPDAWVSWSGIAAMALGSQIFGHTAINAAVRTLSATLVAMATLLEPVFAAITAALVFGERIDVQTGIGALIIVAAIALAIRAEPGGALTEPSP